MKRRGYLWPQVCGFDALWRASRRARRGKRLRPDVAEFEFQLERNLWQLHEELMAHSYVPGVFHTFRIFDPKERWISAAPYRDRVVHHALTAVLEAVFEGKDSRPAQSRLKHRQTTLEQKPTTCLWDPFGL